MKLTRREFGQMAAAAGFYFLLGGGRAHGREMAIQQIHCQSTDGWHIGNGSGSGGWHIGCEPGSMGWHIGKSPEPKKVYLPAVMRG